ncbi:unnamed protein product [Ixodes pacificus]
MEAEAEVAIVERDDGHQNGKTFYFGVGAILFVSATFCAVAFLPRLLPRDLYEMTEVVCASKSCQSVSKLINSSINSHLDPCDDFYTYVCDGWRRSHSLKSSESQRSVFSEVNDRVRSQLHESLLQISGRTTNNTRIRKLALFYQACTKSLTPEGNGVVSIKKFLRRVGMAWPDEDVQKNATDLLELLVTLSMTWNVNVLFSYSIKSLSTGKGVLTLGMPSSLVPSQQSEAKMSLYEKLIVSLAFLLGRKNDYSDLARRLMLIERDVARFCNESKVSTAFNVRDLGNLCADFPWQKWMLALNKNLPARIALTPQKSIIVHHPSYIGRLLTYFLNHDSPENIHAYLALHVLLKYGQATYDIRHVQEIVIYMGKDVPARHIMNTCQQWMSTLMLDGWNTFVSQALTRPEEIERLSQLVTNVKRMFVDRIRKLSWMDARTRNISIQKASNIALSIPRVADHTSSSNKSTVTLPDLQGDFLDMVCTIVDAIRNDEDLFIGQVIDRSDSVTVHSNVNAVYTYSLNVVNVNAALLVIPFYTDDLPVPLNYGGIGAIVAHEIIHGFDASGRLYDDIGEFEDWWSNETSSTYREISACFQEQMQALSPRSGSVTLEENLADNGGIRCAFDAYVFAASQDRRVIQLKGLDSFEEDQLFFLNYCYKFCGVNRDVRPGNRGGESSYPVERLRCNVPLMNLPEFSSAFDCEPGAAMNPSERCSAW